MDQEIPINSKGKVAHRKLNKLQLKAYKSYSTQWNRCHNPKASDYKFYGGRGIQVKYNRADFMAWYINKIKNFPDKEPTISRIDHDGHYDFENIKIESFKENRAERYERKGLDFGFPSKKIGLYSKKTNELIAIFNSMSECARELEKSISVISRACKKRSSKGNQEHSWYYKIV